MKTYMINPLTFSQIHSEITDPHCEIWSAQSVIGKFRVSCEDGQWFAFDPKKKEWSKVGGFAQGVATCDEMLVNYLEEDTLREVGG